MEDVESNTFFFSLKIGAITTYLYAEGSDPMKKETFPIEKRHSCQRDVLE